MKPNIEYKKLASDDIQDDLLSAFNRYQETNEVLVYQNGQLRKIEEHFIDDWDEKKKSSVVQNLKNCVINGGVVIGAFIQEKLVGFTNVDSKTFGKEAVYMEMKYLHTSYGYRGQGIGKQLFNLCCIESKKLGAEKLYISTHAAVDTQAFYQSVGCVPAKEINLELLAKEPFDIQLEFTL